ncbi:MAG TPA: DNA-3-methyladenine glycosylase 2 family protein, partial [Burkholderiaceae bacterium]|nr:DNA-3-methyladenine glycosylase 2 family protein [Burkholderiaceae bacterium]
MVKNSQAEGRVTLPSYWEEAKIELMKRDRIMRKLIPQFGDLHLVGRGEPFTTLARSIVGQQISIKAAESVWARFLELCPKCTPAQVLKAGEKLTTCGLSKRKGEYL